MLYLDPIGQKKQKKTHSGENLETEINNMGEGMEGTARDSMGLEDWGFKSLCSIGRQKAAEEDNSPDSGFQYVHCRPCRHGVI